MSNTSTAHRACREAGKCRLAGDTARAQAWRRAGMDLPDRGQGATLAWTLVVGTTGVMNELATPLFTIWQRTEVVPLVASWRHDAVPKAEDRASVQLAFETAQRAMPAMAVTSIFFPGFKFGISDHYLIVGQGKAAIASRLISPALIDARSGKLMAVVRMLWYLRTLEVSRPLHFGDYGGLPLKIIWALLDIATIIVLGSGLFLWLSRLRLGFGARLGDVGVQTMDVAE